MTALALLLPLLAAAQTTQPADDGPPDVADVAEVVLRVSPEAMIPGEDFRLGFEFWLRQGWHGYWKNPGDAGMPPRVELTLPDGYTAGPLIFPEPKVFEGAGVVGYGYAGVVIYQVEVDAADDAELAGEIKAEIRYLVCDDKLCLPGTASFTVPLPIPDERLGDFEPPRGPAPLEDAFRVHHATPRQIVIERVTADGTPVAPPAFIQAMRAAAEDDDVGYTFLPAESGAIDSIRLETFTIGGKTRLTYEARPLAGQALPDVIDGLLFIDGVAYEAALPLTEAGLEEVRGE